MLRRIFQVAANRHQPTIKRRESREKRLEREKPAVVRKNNWHSSSKRGDAIFVVQAVQDRASHNRGRPVESMPIALQTRRQL